ncbi:MAG: hypothetical protein AB2L24_17590 [Mangrovibacterium sp.]
MKQYLFIAFIAVLALSACIQDDGYSPDINDPSLLPDTGDYLDEDYGTQALAEEIAAAYSGIGNDSCRIGLIIYDNETRTQPLLTFTGGNWPVRFRVLNSGALEFGYTDFQTEMMPLRMTTDIKVLLELNTTQDTIRLRGTDGKVRTEAGTGQPIGTPLPESDDAELEGFYVRSGKRLFILFDLMLPIAVKAHINGSK